MNALAQTRVIWPPEPGYFRISLTRGGWSVPARILRTERDLWQAEIDGQLSDPHHDPAHAANVAHLWHGGIRIDQAEYEWLIATKVHAIQHEPDHPALHPRKPINPRVLRPLIPRTPQ